MIDAIGGGFFIGCLVGLIVGAFTGYIIPLVLLFGVLIAVGEFIIDWWNG
jgi:hypothetical protein